MSGRGSPERLDKILSNSGYGARSEVRKLIRSGAVTCDGAVVKAPDTKFIAESARIEIAGAALEYTKFVYLMMHKPAGVISSTYDPRHRTVTDLLPDRYRARNPFPAGRLDIDATGLLLITNDGDLAHRLLSPKKHIEKEYEVWLDKAPGAEVAEGFRRGVTLDGGIALKPAELIYSDEPGGGVYMARVILTEGKFHQIKRMFAAFGINVAALKRIRMGALALDPGLPPGGFRELVPSELAALLAI